MSSSERVSNDATLRLAIDSFPAGASKLSSVQIDLERNKALIAEIAHNHEQRTPESLQRNTDLIRELNASIGRVVESYKELATLVESVAGGGGGVVGGAGGGGGGAPGASTGRGPPAPSSQ